MSKLGIFVGEHGHWGFFKEIHAALNNHYETQLFEEKVYNLPLLRGRVNRWAYQQQIRNILKQNDVCFFEWASELLVPASHMPKQSAIITRLHSYEVNVWAPQVNWDNVDKIIFVSNYIRKKFLEDHPEQEAKTCIINNGVDLDRFSPITNKSFHFNIGILGTILPVKRVYEAIFTIATLRDAGHHPHLHIGGGKADGGYHDDYYIAVQQVIEKLKLQEHVTMYDHVTDTERWLRKMDIYISNSYWEGQSVALMESMASGCYAMAHFWDGSEDMLPTECIYSSDTDLAKRLLAYAELPAAEKTARCAQMRARACQYYDIRDTTKQIRQLIDEVSDGSSTGNPIEPTHNRPASGSTSNPTEENESSQQVLA